MCSVMYKKLLGLFGLSRIGYLIICYQKFGILLFLLILKYDAPKVTAFSHVSDDAVKNNQ